MMNTDPLAGVSHAPSTLSPGGDGVVRAATRNINELVKTLQDIDCRVVALSDRLLGPVPATSDQGHASGVAAGDAHELIECIDRTRQVAAGIHMALDRLEAL